MKFIFFILNVYFASSFTLYNINKKPILINEKDPYLFRNKKPVEIIDIALKYNININNYKLVTHLNELKKDIYKKYMEDKKIYFIDIDNTICKTKNSNYIHSIPDNVMICNLNKLYYRGNELHYFTARGANSGIDWKDFTKRQLKLWNVEYNTLSLGKPHYDIWIDDKAINSKDFI
jgi:hypothetical protein